MIKTSAMLSAHTIHVLHVLLRDTLILLIILFVALFFWLQSGIHADKLTFAHYEIDGLYIKLDKKLTLEANNIIIPASKADPSLENVDETFDNIKFLFTFFDYIELKKIHFNNNELQVIFADDILYVTSDDYEIAGNIKREGEKYIADVSMLYLKKEDIDIRGELIYQTNHNDNLKVKGEFNAYNIKGNFKASKENDTIDFLLNTKEFSDLKTLIDKFPLNKTVRSWIVEKVQAKQYRLYALSGKGTIQDDDFKIDFDSLKGNILFKDVKIHYKEKLSPVLAKSFILTYKNGGLYFDLKDPTYQGRDLNGSNVSITHLVDKEPTMLNLDLHIKTPLDTVVQEILQAYALHIPVQQKNAEAKLDIKIGIPLKKSTQKISVFVNVDLQEGDVYIGNVKLPVLRGNVQFDKGFVNLKDIDLKESWYEGRVNGKIDIKAKKANLLFDVKQIYFGEDQEKFFILKNKQLPFTLDYRKNLIVDIPTLKIKLVDRPKDFLIQLKQISKVKPYFQDMNIQIDGGKLDITTKDFKTYRFKGELKRNSCFFYDNDNICHTRIPCSGKITEDGLIFNAFDNRLKVNMSKSLVQLKNLNIDLEAFFRAKDKNKIAQDKGEKIVILGKKSKLRYDKFTLVTDSYDIEISQNGNIKALGSLDGDIVKLTKKGNQLSVQALRVKDRMLHPLINFDGLKKGRYTFKSLGDPNKVMKGQIIVEGGIMSDFKAYNNTLAFINTLPALATLHNPGFSGKGFKIKEGVAEYRRIKDRIIFDSIYIQGISATIVGKGELDLKKRTINMKLAIQTARELGNVVGNLPLLGYILMGKDKSMTFGLKITGTLDKPKVNTSATQEILSLPLQMLKRTMELPSQLKKATPVKKTLP
jgi:hypothetical protein